VKIEFTLDLHEYLEGPGDLYGTGVHPITKEGLPRTFGHEFAGTSIRGPGFNHQARFWKLAQTLRTSKLVMISAFIRLFMMGRVRVV